MSSTSPDAPKSERDRQILVQAQQKGVASTLFAFTRLSGPGWLQSAITLGGGSLAGSLYLGVLAGMSLLWLQPLFMILGIIMLSAIGYVTLSTGERPFQAINRHVNPVLGWAWAGATLMANMVWCMPQFALANSVVEQNLFPQLYGDELLGANTAKILVALTVLVLTLLVTWCYGSGHWGIKVYEVLLKLMVAGIVISFGFVVYSLFQSGQVNFAEVAMGFVPSPSGLTQPASSLQALIDRCPEDFQSFWVDRVNDTQKDKIVAAAATAVGINMTFLFPYSLLRKGWTREFRGLQKFDLATGMLIPFLIATSCIVIASAVRFHAQPVPGLVRDANMQPVLMFVDDDDSDSSNSETNIEPVSEYSPPSGKEMTAFYGTLTARLVADIGQEEVDAIKSGEAPLEALLIENPDLFADMSDGRKAELQSILGQQALEERIHQLPIEEQLIAATLVDRDANRLAQSLAPLGDGQSSDLIFGIGVVGMTLSTITILMLISGFVICEIFNLNPSGWTFRIACSVAAVGVLGPFIWSGAGFALAVPTSVFGFMLLPIAYLTFFLLMNQKSLLKDDLPRGGRRWAWNLSMGLAATIATLASAYMVYQRGGTGGMIAAGILVGLAIVAQIYRAIVPRSPQSSVPPRRSTMSK